MKSLKVAKMNINGLLKSITTYYGILVSIIIFFIVFNSFNSGNINMSGIEISTVIFLFVCGLNSFKENYYFAKANNISRKSFLLGILISVIPVTLVMVFIDIVINRVTNIFIKNPTLYDTGFGSLRGVMVWDNGVNNWVQSNSFNVLIGTFMFQLTLCILAYILGLVISMIYYRCNRIMKVVVSVIPVLLSIIWNQIAIINTNIVEISNRFFDSILGVSSGNVLAPITTFIITSLFLSLVTMILIKNSIIKEK